MSGSPGLQRFLAVVGDALARGDAAGAMAFADQAVGQGFEEPRLLTLAGQQRMRLGQPPRALALLERARALAPDNIEALNALGICLTMLGRPLDAIAVFDDALARAPQAIQLKLYKAQPLEEVGRLRESKMALEDVLAAEPDNIHALGRLANLCARRGEMAAARGYAERALAIRPFSSASIALAMADLADGDFAVARDRVAPLIADPASDPATRAIALGLFGDAADGLGDPAIAFAAYTQARETMRGLFRDAGRDSAIERVRRAAAYFREAPAAPWKAGPSKQGPVATHVFLVGFPRSGTTLLEQALAGHRDVRTMEEVDCLGDTAGQYFYAADGLARFAALDEDALDPLRDGYWRRVAASGAPTDRAVFVDKMPLNSIHLGMIARLFPAAKILFALRDPRDVVLSCFRRRLVMSAHMHELSSFAGTVAFYDAVMTLAMLYRATLGLATLDLRHEDMVGDFDSGMARVCTFLDLGWDDAVRDFAAAARDRDVKTPSAAQLVRGLSKDGIGQWRRFAAQMAPALPVLDPWAKRFGYGE